MRIAVCMKAVVEPESRIELGDDGTLVRSHLRCELNEYDLYAVEQAIRIAESHDGQVTVVTVGAEDAVQGLRKGLAMGADDAIHIHSEAEQPDADATAAVLAEVLSERGPEVILAGVESDDIAGSQVGVLLAEKLGYSCVTMTVGTEFTEPGTVRVRRELESGNYVTVDVRLPAVCTVQTGLNEPRYPSLKGIMAAKRKELVRREIDELAAGGAAPRVRTRALDYPPPRERARLLEGSTVEACDTLVRLLREEEKVL